MNYIIIERRGRENTALNKAPEDVVAVARSLGFNPVTLDAHKPKASHFLAKSTSRVFWEIEKFRLLRKFVAGDVLFIQEPPGVICRKSGLDFLRVLKERGVRIVYLIHDIGELREKDANQIALSKALFWTTLSFCDVVITHNASMSDWLADHGYDRSKILSLLIFDYLVGSNVKLRRHAAGVDVAIAGNLSAIKSKYLSQISEIDNINWKLFGPYYDSSQISECGRSKIEYCGSFPPDEVPDRLSASWGLVWDGESIDTCTGATGSYLRYNNPHKLSLFLSCAMPVIVWGESAVASFVKSNHVGIAIKSLRDLPERLKIVTSEQYDEMAMNCQEMAKKLRSGYFTRQAIESALGRIGA